MTAATTERSPQRSSGMRRAVMLAVLLLAAAAVVVAGWRLVRPARDPVASASVTSYLSDAPEGFARVTGPPELDLRLDEGAHPDYQTEWWYYTGNLAATEAAGQDVGRRFGFQLTFFRSALAPEEDARDSEWGTRQAYLAHLAVSDVGAGQFHSAERLARGAVGLAGAKSDPPRVWLGSWSITPNIEPAIQGEEVGTDDAPVDDERPTDADAGAAAAYERPPLRLVAADGPIAIDLVVRPLKPVALHGDAGYSVKGPEPGNASVYYSWTRLGATGVITTADGVFPVEGLSWMDHEWSTSALSEDQVGWDWFSLQLDDDSELMAFQIHEDDGGIAASSSGSLIGPDGAVTGLSATDFAVEVLDTWTSPRTDAEYPSGWRLRVPEHDVDLTVTPLLEDQELSVSFRYWEGAVRVEGQTVSGTVSGYGYVELTGYADSASPGPGM